ncbi:hypothetical protein PS15p_201779 [Mucor circinelloides]
MRVIEMSSFSVILGMPWLRRHCPTLNFDTMQITMNCLLSTRCIPVRYEDVQTVDSADDLSDATSPGLQQELFPTSSPPAYSITNEPSGSDAMPRMVATAYDPPIMEPSVDTYYEHQSTYNQEDTIHLPPPIEQQHLALQPINHLPPPVEFDTIQLLQQQLLETWRQSENATANTWEVNNNDNWLQFIEEHPEEMIYQQLIPTIIDLNRPPQSDNEANDDVLFVREVINAFTPAPPQPMHAMWFDNNDDNTDNNQVLFDDAMNNNMFNNHYLPCFPLCSIIDNEPSHTFKRKLHSNHSVNNKSKLISNNILHGSITVVNKYEVLSTCEITGSNTVIDTDTVDNDVSSWLSHPVFIDSVPCNMVVPKHDHLRNTTYCSRIQQFQTDYVPAEEVN